jgi:hypothetical protein
MQRHHSYFAALFALMLTLGAPLACGGGGSNVVDEPVCGDGVVEGVEECDLDDFNGQFCSDVNPLFVGGYLYCLPTCEIDVAHCELPLCGDDVAEGNEECDGYDMGDIADCKNHGFRCGFTTCNEGDCTLNTDECVLDIPCETRSPATLSQSSIGGYATGGTEYSYIYEGIVDMNDTRAWKVHIELWGDQVTGGLSTTPVNFTEDDLTLNLGETAHLVFLWECMDSSCCLGDGCMLPMKFYVPRAGTLQLTSLEEAPTGTLAGTLDGIEWKQISIDWESGDASAVECGPCYGLDSSWTFDATVDSP